MPERAGRYVSLLSMTPVKSFAVQHPDAIELGPRGVAEDRRFLLVDGQGRLVNGARHGTLVRARATFDGELLQIELPGGGHVSGAIELGAPVAVDWQVGCSVAGRIAAGPFAAALSEFAGFPVQLVCVDEVRAGWSWHPASLIGSASIAALPDAARDARRFRMLVEIGGAEPFEEDTWIGRSVRLGEAVVAVRAACVRCVATNRGPGDGITDFNTMRALFKQRGRVELGIYADVEQAGIVRVGDRVQPL